MSFFCCSSRNLCQWIAGINRLCGAKIDQSSESSFKNGRGDYDIRVCDSFTEPLVGNRVLTSRDVYKNLIFCEGRRQQEMLNSCFGMFLDHCSLGFKTNELLFYSSLELLASEAQCAANDALELKQLLEQQLMEKHRAGHTDDADRLQKICAKLQCLAIGVDDAAFIILAVLADIDVVNNEKEISHGAFLNIKILEQELMDKHGKAMNVSKIISQIKALYGEIAVGKRFIKKRVSRRHSI